VTYATLNVQGSCNNLCDVAPDPAENAARNEADIAWLQQTFAEAKAAGLGRGDADLAGRPGWDLDATPRAPLRDPKTLARDRRPARRLPDLPRRAARRGRSRSDGRSPT
jgi:hypothetical protein